MEDIQSEFPSMSLEDDDEFGEFDCAPPKLTSSKADDVFGDFSTTAPAEDDDDFGAFEEVPRAGPSNKDDDFGGFASFPAPENAGSTDTWNADFSQPVAAEQQHSAVSPSKDDDDFGGFASFPEPENSGNTDAWNTDFSHDQPVTADPQPSAEFPALETLLETNSLWSLTDSEHEIHESEEKAFDFAEFDDSDVEMATTDDLFDKCRRFCTKALIVEEAEALKMGRDTSTIIKKSDTALGMKDKGTGCQMRLEDTLNADVITTTDENLRPVPVASSPPIHRSSSEKLSFEAAYLLARLPRLGFLRSKILVFPE